MKAALVIGASRGIGRQIAITLAKHNYKVGVASKTVVSSDKLPGSIHSVVEEIKSFGGKAIAFQCNTRDEKQIENTVKQCIEKFGGLDTVIYNAGAVTWDKVINTPLKRFDMMTDVNVRGAYCTLQSVLPHFMEKNSGRIILVSPPIYSRFFQGKTAYSVGKVGMTILVSGLGHELKDTGVSVSALWPATAIESHVTKVGNLDKSLLRKADIFADACQVIVDEPTMRYNGQALIDEDLLRERGVTDFTPYRCDPEIEPSRMMPKVFPSPRVAEEDIQSKL